MLKILTFLLKNIFSFSKNRMIVGERKHSFVVAKNIINIFRKNNNFVLIFSSFPKYTCKLKSDCIKLTKNTTEICMKIQVYSPKTLKFTHQKHYLILFGLRFFV